MLLPRISTYADRSVIRSSTAVLHDAAWLVETALVETRVTCILDATVPVAHPQRAVLDRLAAAIGPSRRIVLCRDEAPAWAAPWHAQRRVEVSTRGQLDVAEARIAAGLEHGSAVVLVAGAPGSLTGAVLAALRGLRPDLRLFVAIAAGASAVLEANAAELAASNGGSLLLGAEHRVPWTLELAIEAMPDVELVVHAAPDPRDPRAIPRPPLTTVDRLRVDAITPHVDDPVFVVRAVVQPPDLLWPIATTHIARRTTARLPRDDA